MTIMGMAASQARFLGLTARKSNVEYQGQQINQQRTALANESANLYNQMMELTVPTPPATSDYYSTSYVLDNSSDSYATEDYTISNLSKTYNRENEYLVTLTTKKEQTGINNPSYRLNTVVQNDDGTYKIALVDKDNSGSILNLSYDPANNNAYTGDNDSLHIEQNRIYKVNPDKELDGYKQYIEDSREQKDKDTYFFQDTSGKNHFITEEQLNKLLSDNEDKYNDLYAIATTYTYQKEESTQVLATLESSSTGRYSSIQIYENDDYSNSLKGKTFTLSTVQNMDQNAYDDAYNDYEYQKYLYEKTISDINAKTEVIQNQDQQLELRLDQLDTEQNAIKTEMDAVTKVIEDNVEQTFKTFA